MDRRCGVFALAMAVALVGVLPVRADDTPDAAKIEFFEKKIRPILTEHCQKCHGTKKSENGLRLDSRDSLLQGGDSGPAIIPGNAEESLLVDAIRHGDTFQMPPDAKLKSELIDLIVEWVQDGAVWPESKSPPAKQAPVEQGKINPQARQFWSFQPVKDHAPPAVKNTAWPKGSLDHFILAKLEEQGLSPSAPADPRTLLRRLTFDLIGLPPTPEELAEFEQSAIGAPATAGHPQFAIDRLLASPHYGERWARHWLDVARYGEDQAHTFQARLYPNGFRYRDWVVKAFNDDLPYDRFITEQIAADLLERADDARRDNLPALGFLALGPVYYGDGGCAGKAAADGLDDRVDTLCRGFLGLTVACARCHDHKFDPIPTRDYYSLAGVLKSSEYKEYPVAPPEVIEAYDKALGVVKAKEDEAAKFVETESARLTESLAGETAKYLLTAWQYENRRKGGAKTTIAEFAKEAELHESVLDKWLDFLKNGKAENRPVLLRWRELIAAQNKETDLSGDEAARADAARVADEFQREIVAMLADRKSLEKSKAEFLTEIVGDKGVLNISKRNIEKMLPKESQKTLADLKAEADKLKKSLPPKYPVAHAMTDGKAENMKIYLRGNPANTGDEAPRRFLTILAGDEAPEFSQGSGRLELARAVASIDNPLTARVLVNRIWKHHFGRGLVGTPSNFGSLGQRPTHPELLDYLASRFMASGWSIKALHREILLSATYRQSSRFDQANHEKDPDNQFLWRANRRRLEVEAWRDAMLAVSGNLDRTLGGPSVDLSTAGNRRRTFYAAVSRHNLNGVLRLFDFPDPNLTADARPVTTVPLQQLFVLNSDFMVEQAKALVARLNTSQSADNAAHIGRAFELLYGRPASDDEVQLGVEYLSASDKNEAGLSRWEQYAQVLLAANEFAFVD